jgi:hypothetical protein
LKFRLLDFEFRVPGLVGMLVAACARPWFGIGVESVLRSSCTIKVLRVEVPASGFRMLGPRNGNFGFRGSEVSGSGVRNFEFQVPGFAGRLIAAWARPWFGVRVEGLHGSFRSYRLFELPI